MLVGVLDEVAVVDVKLPIADGCLSSGYEVFVHPLTRDDE